MAQVFDMQPALPPPEQENGDDPFVAIAKMDVADMSKSQQQRKMTVFVTNWTGYQKS